MDTSMQILVIILSCALAVLLVLSIVVVVLVVKLLKAISRITEKAEHIIESAEHVGAAFSEATGKMALFNVVRNVVSMVNKHSKKSK